MSRGATSSPSISFIIATLGRESLKDALASIETYPGDEILVMRQTEPIPWDFGNSMRNKGMEKATGDYLAFMDDDDAYYPGHREKMDKAAKENPGKPMLFKVRFANNDRVVWDDEVFRSGNMSTLGIFVPNQKDKLPQWITETKDKIVGDFQFMNHLGWRWKTIVFIPEIIALAKKQNDGTRWQKAGKE